MRCRIWNGNMRNLKPKAKYQGISLPEEFIDELKKHVMGNPRYKSVADFAREALREKMDREKNNSSAPQLSEDNIVSIVSRVLQHELGKLKKE